MTYGFQTIESAIDAALYLESNQVMQLVVLFRLITSLLAWIVMTSVYKSIHNMRAHKGLVLLLRIHYFWTHYLCSCAIFDAAMIIYKSVTWENPEDLLNSGFLCFIRKVPYSVALANITLQTAILGGSISLLIIVIERRQASVYVRTYESAGIRLALKLSIFEVLYLICFFAGASTMFDFNLNFAHCTAVTASSEKFMSVAALTVLIVQMAALIVFRKLLRRNVNFLERDNESLSERYQIKENIRTLNLLVPLVETQFILTFTPIYMWLLYATIPHGLDPRAYPVFEESINVIQLTDQKRKPMTYGYLTIEDAIDAAMYLEKSDIFQMVVLFRLITSVLAWIAMTSVYSSIHNMHAHKGLVLLLRIHYFWTHYLCSCAIFDAAMEIYNSVAWDKPEDLLNGAIICFIRKMPYGTTLCGESISLLLIVVERWQASVHVRIYEKSGLRMALQFSVVHLLYVIGFFTGGTYLFDFDYYYAHCTTVTPTSEIFMSLSGLSIICIQIFALVVFRKLLRRNKQFLLRDNESLSERYQIKENIRTLNLLLPLVQTQFILNVFPVFMWLMYQSVPHGFDPRGYPIFEECINVVQLYGIVMPLLVVRSHRKDQQRKRNELSTNRNSKESSSKRHVPMSSSNDLIVENAIFVYTAPYMLWMIPFRIVTSVLGVIVISIMMAHWKSVLQSKFVAHFNLTFLLAIHVIFNLLSCLFVAIDDIYIAYQQHTWRSGEDLVLPGSMFSLVVISIERFIATLFYKTYEQCPKWLGAWFGLAEILIPLICTGIATAYFDFPMKFSYCTIVSPGNFAVMISISYVFLSCEFFALVLFHISLFINWRRMKNRATMDPTGRYQITENFRTIATVTPLIWCHFLIMIGTVGGFMIYNAIYPDFDKRTYPIIEETVNQIYWHGILLPYIFYALYRYGKRQDLRVLADNGVGQHESRVVIDKHERAIQRGWKNMSVERINSASMSVPLDPIVDTAIFVYSDPFMKWMIPFRIATALLGVVVISIMIYHWKKFVAHFNLTFLLAIHVIFNLLSCLFVAIDDIYILYQQLTWRTGEDLVLTGFDCYAWRAPPCVTLYGTMFSLVIISIERFIATLCYKNYEQCPKWLGVMFGLAEILIPIICTGIDTIDYNFSAKFSYCTIVSDTNFEVDMQIAYIFLVCEFFALILFHISLFINWRRMRSRATMDPTGRYQITENFRTSHFLIMIGSFAFFFAYLSFIPTFDPRILAPFTIVVSSITTASDSEGTQKPSLQGTIKSSNGDDRRMATTMDPIVDTAIFVYTDPYMRWMIPFRIGTALVGVVVIAIMFYHRKSVFEQKFVAHFNLTFLLAIHVIFNFFACLFVAIDDIYILYQQLTWKTGTDLVLTGTMFSLIIISVERCIATLFYKNYEQCPKWLGAWFGLAEIIIPFMCASIISSYYNFSERFAYCSIVSESNFEVVMQIGYIFLVLEFLALITFHVALFVNWRRRKNRATMDPTGRYQITENFRTIAMITPLIWCHFLIILGSAAVFFLCSNHRDRRLLKENGVGQQLPEIVIANHEKAIQKGW
ncbi:hypothetical protein PRIPAC_84399 [Pristionchus pacificus]|uniref:G protein-coupled receptor n=1 Tax=Pristionchus pacificus TaxID=54126 RepID=A0A2A6BUP8_PRIPA|nr:hypothetical protein PRIPAC_84399 [Pristionchus pacificus]|eukprot:PDM69702.1 G protein-coupled receptor [Pristionchus pacificus]